MHWGIVVSVILSIGAGMLLARARNQSLWEGILGIAAAVLVASLTVHMWRAGRHMKKDIEGRLAASSVKTGDGGLRGRLCFHTSDDYARGHGDGDARERAALQRAGR